MNKTIKTAFLVVTLASLVLAAGCNLKASTAPTVIPTATSELDFVITPTAGESITNQIATQTAVAQNPVVTATAVAPAPGEATPVPEVKPTAIPAEVQSTAKPVPPAAIPTLTRPTTYTLQKGEWPICIARRFDLNLASFLAANSMGMESRPATGAVLNVPSTGNWTDSASGPRALHNHTDYMVTSSDSVYTIACYFGDVSPEGILAANGLSSAADVKAGVTLKIP